MPLGRTHGPLVKQNALVLGKDRKSFAMRTYEKCTCKVLGIRTYEIVGLKVL